jgi:Mor family transcriptional regulator
MPDLKPKPIPFLTQKDLDRFLSKVSIGSPDECWPWMGTVSGDGYAHFWIGEHSFKAHRISAFLATGVDCGVLLIRHTCDHKWCVNPNHLVTGTHKQNSADAVERNRLSGFNAKLSEDQVRGILRDRSDGMSIPSLCIKYQITMGAIIPIIKGKTWRKIAGPRERQKKHLTREVRDEIRAKRVAGAILKDLAKEYDMSIGAIHALCDGTTWQSDFTA